MEEKDIERLILKGWSKNMIMDGLIQEALKHDIKFEAWETMVITTFYHSWGIRSHMLKFLPWREKEIKRKLKKLRQNENS